MTFSLKHEREFMGSYPPWMRYTFIALIVGAIVWGGYELNERYRLVDWATAEAERAQRPVVVLGLHWGDTMDEVRAARPGARGWRDGDGDGCRNPECLIEDSAFAGCPARVVYAFHGALTAVAVRLTCGQPDRAMVRDELFVKYGPPIETQAGSMTEQWLTPAVNVALRADATGATLWYVDPSAPYTRGPDRAAAKRDL